MNIKWTTKKPIFGLSHFVLVNEFKDNEETFFVLVSVLDADINLTIPKKKFEESKLWDKGWSNKKTTKADIRNYLNFKDGEKKQDQTKIFLNNLSPFNIS